MIEALLLSVDEPQLNRCLKSMNEQTIPFSNIVHINNVVPQSEAYNRGLSLLRDDWFVLTAGDVCLYPDAVNQCVQALETTSNDKIVGHSFLLYDSFLELNWGGISIFRRDVYQTMPIMNRLSNDRSLGRKLDSRGWMGKRHLITIGVHFDSPDEYQVFRRFYVVGLKYNGKAITDMGTNLNKILERTGNSLYKTALKAMEFASEKRTYPGSHNVEFEKKMYEEFNAIQETSPS